jgi:hypothetical protein
VDAELLIDRNRRLLVMAEATRALTRRVIDETAENCLMAHVTLLRTVHLHYGRCSLLADMIYLRRAIADEMAPQAPHYDNRLGRSASI